MEEEIMRSLNQKANNNQPGAPMPSANISMSSKIFSGDAKRMSFDENMPQPSRYGVSPLSSILSQSPGSGWGTSGTPNMQNQGRRDSLKNLWHLQDFGTD